MQIHIERAKCEGHGQCFLVSETLFPLDDQGYSAVVDGTVVPAGAEGEASFAIDSCPAQALRAS